MSKYSGGHYDGENGVHGVPVWRIAGFALNNTATNFYSLLLAYVAYYLTGFVGMGVVLAGSFATIMRVWDGVTDPFIGLLLDRTNGKFGKNRPFMVIGQLILLGSSWILFHVTHLLPEVFRIPFFFLFAALFYIGYTFQCVVTKSAQTCLTNDPKQRPVFAVFDAIYNNVILVGLGMWWVSGWLVPRHGDTFYSTELFHELWLAIAIVAGIFTIIAVISIAPKDNEKYFGLGGQGEKITFRDYADVMTHNRAMQMLVLSASTDKLASNAKTSTVTVIMFGIVAGNYALSGAFNAYTSVVSVLFIIFGIGVIATQLGQRKAMLMGTIGGLVSSVLLIMLWVFGDPTTLSLPGVEGFTGFNFISIALFVLTIVNSGFTMISSNIVIPMTADVADYETYRSGRYVPGMIGTIFSFVDKLISSLAPLIASLALALIGYTEKMPDVSTPYSGRLFAVGLFCMYGMVIVGLICNLIGMHFYPLTKEFMEEIQNDIAAIKAKAAASA